MRPDRYLKMAAAMRREGMGITVGFASAAQRCPDRPGLVDELGTLTWRQLDERIDALAAALQALPGQAGTPRVIGIMCRNHSCPRATSATSTGRTAVRRRPRRRDDRLRRRERLPDRGGEDAGGAPRGGRGRGDRRRRRAVRPAAGGIRGARARRVSHARRPSSNTSGRTWPTTRCPAKSPSSTSFRAAAPARSCAPNCNRGSAADDDRVSPGR